MTLATHAVVGGTLVALFPSHPVTAFIAGFMSHFILDAIPHWDYKILSAFANPDIAMSANASEVGISKRIMADKKFLLDLVRIGTDALLGLAVVFVFWYSVISAHWYIMALGAIGGMMPDFLQFVYMRFPYQPMVALQKFHTYLMHSKLRLDGRPLLGVTTQILTVIIVVVLVKYLVKF